MRSAANAIPVEVNAGRARRRKPLTLWVGLGIMLACEVLLAIDVRLTGRGALHTPAEVAAVAPPATPLGFIARWAAVHMTSASWVGYVVFLEGVLTMQAGPGGASPVRRRPHHFASMALASVLIWCVFDWINFYFIRAWQYLGVPPRFFENLPDYFLAFGAVVPGMMMSGQVLMNWGLFDWARSPRRRMPPWMHGAALLAGVAMFAWPLIHHDPVTNFTLWTSLIFLLDPLNLRLGRPSMFRDFQNCWYGRTLAAFAGGLVCGLLWEFWNYWAIAKWTYHLPFLGRAEHYRYFEMPLPGLLGFLPFGMECWVMWQTIRIPLDGMVEPLPDERSLL